MYRHDAKGNNGVPYKLVSLSVDSLLVALAPIFI